MTSTEILVLVGVVLAVVLAGALAIVARKGRPFAAGDVFRASRLSLGNHLFPTQVLITPSSVVHFTPQWIGKLEHTIHIAHVASVRIDTNLIFSNVFIETTGGVSPIRCYGHHKGDAVRMKHLIDEYQSRYFQAPGSAPGTAPGTVGAPPTGR